MMKRILIITAFIVLAGVLIAAGIFWRSRSNNTHNEDLPGAISGGDIVTEGVGQPGDQILPQGETTTELLPLEKFGDPQLGRVLDYTENQNGEIIFVQEEGSVSIYLPEKRVVESMGDPPEGKAFSALFSADGRFLLRGVQGTGEVVVWEGFDTETKTWFNLPEPVYSPTWDKNAAVLAYFTHENQKNTLKILDLSEENLQPRTIVTLSAEDVLIEWKDGDNLFLYTTTGGRVSTPVFQISLQDGSVVKILDNIYGLQLFWGSSPDEGLAFLKNEPNNPGGSLYLWDEEQQLFQKIGFTTLASKCGFGGENANRFFVCAIPTNRIETWFLPDEYDQKKFFTDDIFYLTKFPLESITPIPVEFPEPVDATSVKIFATHLFFVNRRDGFIYKADIGSLMPVQEEVPQEEVTE